VGVALDEAGRQHVVGEASLDPVRPPSGQFVQAARAEDAAAAHGDMGGGGAARIEGDDAARLENGRLVHGPAPATAARIEAV
jgi:hypothetical protein